MSVLIPPPSAFSLLQMPLTLTLSPEYGGEGSAYRHRDTRSNMRLPLIVLPFVICLASATTAAEPRRPNVLFVAVDDLNDWVAPLGGHPQAKTPNLDRLARRGVTFTRAYCAAPACNPSRVALLTGVRPGTSGVYHNPQPWRPVMPDAVTLPQHFMANGYHAAAAGKIFHEAFADPASWHEHVKTPGGAGGGPKPQEPARAGGIVWGALDAADEQMPDYRNVSWVIDRLKRYEVGGKPFFLACGLHKPHMPWQVPQKYYDLYPLDQIKLPDVPADDLKDVPPAGVRIARPQGDHANVLRTDQWKQAVQGYLASISFADAQIGRLLDALDASPHRDQTVVVLWGDHGWHLGEKHHWRKFALWEEATRNPLFVVAPGVTKPGTRCDRTVSLMDLYPTLSDLCGLPAPQRQEGVSLRLLLENPSAPWDRPALTTHGRGSHAVRSERFRYICYADGSEELYDHDADPMEWTNLANDPKYVGAKKELAKWLPEKDAPDAPAREPAANRRGGRVGR